MKKFISLILIVIALSFAACGDDRAFNGKQYTQYGLFNMSDKDPNVRYKVVVGNVFWGIVLFETIAAPVILFGWKVYEPVGLK